MHRLALWLSHYDDTLILYVNRRWKCRFLDIVMPKITHLGGATATILFLIAWFFFSKDEWRMWAIEGLVALGSSHLVVQLLKFSLPRIRPYLQLSGLYTLSKPLTDYSFPSGHTTAIFSIAVIFMYHLPMTIPVLLPLAIMVGLSRMYLALHYPTDVLMGTCLGTFFAFATLYLSP